MKLLSLLIFAFMMGFPAFAEVKTGSAAPGFSLKGDDGKTHKLSDHKGKYVILEWYNEGCPYVKKYYNSGRMQDLQKEFTDRGVVWYSVISSRKGSQGYADLKGAKALRKKHKMNSSAILLDETGKTGRAYGAKTTPHMFIINPEGLVVYQGAIDDRPSANKKSLQGAKNYVKLAFADLDANKPVKVSDTKPYGCSVKY